jgi:hypothetical protein
MASVLASLASPPSRTQLQIIRAASLKANVHKITRFDHLLGRLRKPRLIPVDRRDGEKAGEKKHQPDDRQQYDRTEVTRRGKVKSGEQPAAGIRWFHRLLACSKAPRLDGLNHVVRIR